MASFSHARRVIWRSNHSVDLAMLFLLVKCKVADE
jgi:hypothetical protein